MLEGGSGWGFFNAILGWTNSATYGSVISYNLYWLFVITSLFVLRYRETKGRYPFFKSKHAPRPSRRCFKPHKQQRRGNTSK